ncbi:hypothetical protein ACX12M_13935, partial [Cellulosimicrobium cellulans]
HDVLTKLTGIGPGHSNILPACSASKRSEMSQIRAAAPSVEAERDAARGKLDKVRDLAHQPIGFRVNGSFEPVIRTRDVLAILDWKAGD